MDTDDDKLTDTEPWNVPLGVDMVTAPFEGFTHSTATLDCPAAPPTAADVPPALTALVPPRALETVLLPPCAAPPRLLEVGELPPLAVAEEVPPLALPPLDEFALPPAGVALDELDVPPEFELEPPLLVVVETLPLVFPEVVPPDAGPELLDKFCDPPLPFEEEPPAAPGKLVVAGSLLEQLAVATTDQPKRTIDRAWEQ